MLHDAWTVDGNALHTGYIYSILRLKLAVGHTYRPSDVFSAHDFRSELLVPTGAGF
jgi:hypothetical protein